MSQAQQDTSIRLQVAGARETDVGKGTARISQTALQRLGISEGAIIEITGKRSTAAMVLPPLSEDEGLDIVRLDGLQRASAGVGIRDSVEIRAAEVKQGRRVVLAPAQAGTLR